MFRVRPNFRVGQVTPIQQLTVFGLTEQKRTVSQDPVHW